MLLFVHIILHLANSKITIIEYLKYLDIYIKDKLNWELYTYKLCK